MCNDLLRTPSLGPINWSYLAAQLQGAVVTVAVRVWYSGIAKLIIILIHVNSCSSKLTKFFTKFCKEFMNLCQRSCYLSNQIVCGLVIGKQMR